MTPRGGRRIFAWRGDNLPGALRYPIPNWKLGGAGPLDIFSKGPGLSKRKNQKGKKHFLSLEWPCQARKSPSQAWTGHPRPKRAHPRPDRAHPRLEKAHLCFEKVRPRPEGLSNTWRAHLRPEKVFCKPEKIQSKLRIQLCSLRPSSKWGSISDLR